MSSFPPSPYREPTPRVDCPGCRETLSPADLIELFSTECPACSANPLLTFAGLPQHSSFAENMSRLLIRKRLLTQDELDDILETKKDSSRDGFVPFLLSIRYVSREELENLASDLIPPLWRAHFALCNPRDPFYVDKLELPDDILKRVPPNVARVYKIVPIHFEDEILTVATARPDAEQLCRDLESLLHCRLCFVWASPEALQIALRRFYQPEQAESIEALLKKFGLRDRVPPERVCTTRQELIKWSARQLGMDYCDLTRVNFTPELLRNLPAAIACEYNMVPVTITGEVLTVAVTLPLDFFAQESLRLCLRRDVRFVVSREKDIRNVLREHYIRR